MKNAAVVKSNWELLKEFTQSSKSSVSLGEIIFQGTWYYLDWKMGAIQDIRNIFTLAEKIRLDNLNLVILCNSRNA